MKPTIFPRALLLIFLAGLSLFSRAADTEDTYLFMVNPEITAQRPNILFVLDNTTNWGANNKFEDEKAALLSVVGSLSNQFNVGLMMFTRTGVTGGYVRSAVRQMTANIGATIGNKTRLLNQITALDPTGDAVPQADGKVGLVLYEAYLYFAGKDSRSGRPAGTTDGQAQADPGAYLSGGIYRSPITESCQKNFIIYISNGQTKADVTAKDLLTAIGGNGSSSITLPSDLNGQQSVEADEYAQFFSNNDCNGTVAGIQTVTTYVLEVSPPTVGQGPHWTALMKSMASQGKGKYFLATSATTVAATLNSIFEEVQAVNSVFASSTLPVSVSVRGTYLNQVYMGVFRPDGNLSPRWTGNLKQYKLAVDSTSGSLFLAAKSEVAAAGSTGFMAPGVTSFWTTASTFWDASYYPPATQGVGLTSDAPDGDLVEKGGAAQHLRTAHVADQTTRKLYTCTTCTSGTALSASPFNTNNTILTNAPFGLTTNLINWVRGQNVLGEDNPSGLTTAVRGYLHGDVVHSRPAVINYNRTAGDRDIMVYYGANDGIFHAVKGGQDDADGDEKWGFIPTELFGNLNRLYSASPIISSSNPKPYFVDGPVSAYTKDANNDGKYFASDNDLVYLYMGMRRGGRFYYALNVSDPDNPKFLWKKSNTDTGFDELGQTWSEPKVAKISYQTDPVLIFGLGYDSAANGAHPQTPANMGRGVMVVDALTGAPIWQAGPAPVGAAFNKMVAGMIYSFPADMTILDRDANGNIDRIYAADTGGNVWRINIANANPDLWTVTLLASVGQVAGSVGGAVAANARTFLYPPDVVYAVGYDAVLIGSGDRERPFDTTIQNRFYMFKDDPSVSATKTLITETGATSPVQPALYDATSNFIQSGTAAEKATATIALNNSSGWYMTFRSGEKVVGSSTTLGGATHFATNTPSSTLAADSCTSNLGEARIYVVNYQNAAAIVDSNASGTLTTADRSSIHPGGGYPPSPVHVVVEIGGKKHEGIVIGTNVTKPPSIVLGQRTRTYWYKK